MTICMEAELNALSTLPSDVTEIIIAPGCYHLAQPLIFEKRKNLTLRAEGEVTLIGGTEMAVTWEKAGENLYRASLALPNKPDGLMVGNEPYHMARYPHAGTGDVYCGTASDALEFAARSIHPEGAYLHAMHSHLWGDMHYEITGLMDDGTPDLRGGWQNNRPMGMHAEYRYVENIREALGAPKEYYYDGIEGALFVFSEGRPDSQITAITTPYFMQFIQCDEITLMGLRFAHSARTFMAEYEPLLRSDWCIHRGGAVFFEGGHDAQVHACEFGHIGSNAIFFSGSVRGARVTSCHFHNLGASAVCFVGKTDSVRDAQFVVDHPGAVEPVRDLLGIGPQSENYVSDCLVEDCLIHDIGQIEKQVAAVQISMAARITMRHLSVYRCPRAAFNISEGTFGGHLIEYCDAFDTVLETGDHGTFNGWGRDRFWHQSGMSDAQLRELALRDAIEPSRIRYNRMRCDHGWDIDLDDGCSNYVVEGNLCLNGGIKLREGFCRVVRNNICLNNGIHTHVWYEASGDVIENNITTQPYKPIIMPACWGKQVDFNILHVPGMEGIRAATALKNLSGQDEHSVAMDVNFADPQKGDWTIVDRTVSLFGFMQPPVTGYGVRSSWLRAMAEEPVIPGELEPYRYADSKTYEYQGILMKNVETDGEMSAFQTAGHQGVIVLEVPEFHPLRGVGIVGNQAIIAVDGFTVGDFAQLTELLEERRGREVALTLKNGDGILVRKVQA